MSKQVKDAVEYLRKYKMTVMMHNANWTWVNLVSDCGVGCIIEETDGNAIFTMCAAFSFGNFKYTSLHISHLGKASDLAFNRTSAVVNAVRGKVVDA